MVTRTFESENAADFLRSGGVRSYVRKIFNVVKEF